MDRVETIRQQLSEVFSPTQLDIVDESHKHKGHPGAASGGGHFNVTIISEQFAGQPMLARHQLVYAALGDLMSIKIHALSIKALTPEE